LENMNWSHECPYQEGLTPIGSHPLVYRRFLFAGSFIMHLRMVLWIWVDSYLFSSEWGLRIFSPSFMLEASACRSFKVWRKGFREHELIARVLLEGKAHTSWLASLAVPKVLLAGLLGHNERWFFESESVCWPCFSEWG
jgi:hypothetical protein